MGSILLLRSNVRARFAISAVESRDANGCSQELVKIFRDFGLDGLVIFHQIEIPKYLKGFSYFGEPLPRNQPVNEESVSGKGFPDTTIKWQISYIEAAILLNDPFEAFVPIRVIRDSIYNKSNFR